MMTVRSVDKKIYNAGDSKNAIMRGVSQSEYDRKTPDTGLSLSRPEGWEIRVQVQVFKESL